MLRDSVNYHREKNSRKKLIRRRQRSREEVIMNTKMAHTENEFSSSQWILKKYIYLCTVEDLRGRYNEEHNESN